MFLVNLYGDFTTEINAIEAVLFDGENTIALVETRDDIPDEVRRWNTGDWKEGEGFIGEIRIGHELSRFGICRNKDGTYTAAWYPPGWQPVKFTGTLAECADWYNDNKFLEALTK